MSAGAVDRNASTVHPLPKDFTSIQNLLEGAVMLGRLVNVIGVVKDCRAAIETRGTDYKMEVTILDMSTQDEGRGIAMTIFRPPNQMPEVNATDIVMAYSVKVQQWGGSTSLITNFRTTIHVYSAALVPKLPGSAAVALKDRTLPCVREPTQKENECVSYLCHNLDKSQVPDQERFQEMVTRSANVRDKFSVLGKVTDGRFHNIIAQVIKDPYDLLDKVTIWITDYSENSAFYHYVWDGAGVGSGAGGPVGLGEEDGDADPYGYLKKFSKPGASSSTASSAAWPGPFGKLSMQVTCYDSHASFIRSEVKAGTWVHLRNVQIKYGSNMANLEGFLRSDREYPDRLYVDILDTSHNNENVDPRLKEAIRRKRDYEKAKKHQVRRIRGESGALDQKQGQQKPSPATSAGPTKRKAGEEVLPGNTSSKQRKKQRRKEERAAKFKAAADQELKKQEALGLNDLVKCENFEHDTSPLSTLLEPVFYETNIAGQDLKLELPFTNVNYRANVRVIDFRPDRLEDFAVRAPRRSEYDLLSDCSDASSNSSSSSQEELTASLLDDNDGEISEEKDGHGWEWRFALLLEDAVQKKKPSGPEAADQPDRVWVEVGNPEAQLLTGYDAANLRAKPALLLSLREQLFKLWGNLEEVKVLEQERIKSSKQRLAKGLPPPSSDAEDRPAVVAKKDPAGATADSNDQVLNKPFPCCIRQYGRKVKASKGQDADAGVGKRWERVFGLFGTKIAV